MRIVNLVLTSYPSFIVSVEVIICSLDVKISVNREIKGETKKRAPINHLNILFVFRESSYQEMPSKKA
jgi:hypothetical protein